MPTNRLRRTAASAILATLALTAACHRNRAPVQALEPQVAYTAAMRKFRGGHYAEAQVDFQRLQFDLPGRDSLLPRIRYYLAETYAAQGDLITAAREFRRVADDYPSDPLAPQSLLRVGEQYGQLWRRAELDPTHGETALQTFQELLGRYPDSHAARVAQVRVTALQDQYARKDYQNGMFYLRRGGFDSAILYFRGLIARYPGSSLVPDAYLRLVDAYAAIGYREERDEVCGQLRQHFGTLPEVRQTCGSGGNGSPGR